MGVESVNVVVEGKRNNADPRVCGMSNWAGGSSTPLAWNTHTHCPKSVPPSLCPSVISGSLTAASLQSACRERHRRTKCLDDVLLVSTWVKGDP